MSSLQRANETLSLGEGCNSFALAFLMRSLAILRSSISNALRRPQPSSSSFGWSGCTVSKRASRQASNSSPVRRNTISIELKPQRSGCGDLGCARRCPAPVHLEAGRLIEFHPSNIRRVRCNCLFHDRPRPPAALHLAIVFRDIRILSISHTNCRQYSVKSARIHCVMGGNVNTIFIYTITGRCNDNNS